MAHYGAEYISGSILIDAIPYRSMHPEVAHPAIMEILPRIFSNDATEFSRGVREFLVSCTAPGRSIPYADMCMWAGAILLQVFSIITCTMILLYIFLSLEPISPHVLIIPHPRRTRPNVRIQDSPDPMHPWVRRPAHDRSKPRKVHQVELR